MKRALEEDWPEVRELALAFNEHYYDVPVDTSRLRSWFDNHLTHGVIFLGKSSFVSALIIQDPVRQWTAAIETGWFSKDRHGARLLFALIEYAKEVGADELRMTTLNTSPPEARYVLKRLGFELDRECSHSLIF